MYSLIPPYYAASGGEWYPLRLILRRLGSHAGGDSVTTIAVVILATSELCIPARQSDLSHFRVLFESIFSFLARARLRRSEKAFQALHFFSVTCPIGRCSLRERFNANCGQSSTLAVFLIGYQAGFGEKKSLGFGMVTIIGAVGRQKEHNYVSSTPQ
jgi:hypothetical protein